MAAASGGAHWSSRFAFVMASVGFAVGLGNIWRFPYVTGENGGGAFVLVYLACVFAIGVPCLMAELLIGRRGGHSPPESMAQVALEAGQSRHWSVVGGMGIVAGFIIATVYVVVVGWVLRYLMLAVTTGFAGIDAAAAEVGFSSLLADNSSMMLWTLLGSLISGGIIFAGVQGGIERAVTVMMPLMFVLLIGLALYNAFTGGFRDTLLWLFTPDFSKLDGGTVLAAVGQAFFSISVGLGGMMTFGAYLPKSFSIVRGAVVIVVADTLVALLAGFVVFPAVFHFDLDIASGAGLIFQTLPVAFAQMPGGHLFAVLFFVMLAVAGITSCVGLFEAITAWVDERFAISRHTGAALVVGAVTIGSLASVLSYNVWAEVRLAGMNFNDLADKFATGLLLPLGALLMAFFAGWLMRRDVCADELDTSPEVFGLWRGLLRFLVVPAIAIILITGLF